MAVTFKLEFDLPCSFSLSSRLSSSTSTWWASCSAWRLRLAKASWAFLAALALLPPLFLGKEHVDVGDGLAGGEQSSKAAGGGGGGGWDGARSVIGRGGSGGGTEAESHRRGRLGTGGRSRLWCCRWCCGEDDTTTLLLLLLLLLTRLTTVALETWPLE